MPDEVRETVFVDHMVSTLSASFAVLATPLAAIGLWGVLAYSVAQREIGVRMALAGARCPSHALPDERSDPAVIRASAALLALVALAAGYVPALRASRVDLMQALRYE